MADRGSRNLGLLPCIARHSPDFCLSRTVPAKFKAKRLNKSAVHEDESFDRTSCMISSEWWIWPGGGVDVLPSLMWQIKTRHRFTTVNLQF